jgi:hypothetical protein
VASGVDVAAVGGASDLDYHLSSGTLQTGSGAVTINGDATVSGSKSLTTGTGAVTINGPVSIASGVDITAVGSTSDIAYGSSSGAFTSPTGTNTLSGDIVVAKGKGLTVSVAGGAGAGVFDFSGSTGAFTTSSGANTISGDTTISGSKTFTTGTGAVSLKGDTTLDAGKLLTLTAGAGYIRANGVTSGGITIDPIDAGTGQTTIVNQAGTATITLPATTSSLATIGLQETLDQKTLTNTGAITQTGAVTFGTGTAAVSLNGDTTIASGKILTAGPIKQRTLTKGADYTIQDTDADFYFVGNTSATMTLLFPTASANAGRVIAVMVTTDPGSFDVVLDGENAEQIDGANTKTTTDAVGSYYYLICDGTAWRKFNSAGTWT